MALSTFFTEAVLPFLLVFVVTFAALQRAKVLGDGKKQQDAIVALVIGLILISVPFARNIVVNLMPWLAIGITVLLLFFILYGFVGGTFIDANTGAAPKWMKITFGILIGIFCIAVVSYVTGLGDLIWGYFDGAQESLGSTMAFVLIIAAALAVVLFGGKGSSSSK